VCIKYISFVKSGLQNKIQKKQGRILKYIKINNK
jgi:hypothetical protein